MQVAQCLAGYSSTRALGSLLGLARACQRLTPMLEVLSRASRCLPEVASGLLSCPMMVLQCCEWMPPVGSTGAARDVLMAQVTYQGCAAPSASGSHCRFEFVQVQAPARLRGRRSGATGRAPEMPCRPSALQHATCCPRCVWQPPSAATRRQGWGWHCGRRIPSAGIQEAECSQAAVYAAPTYCSAAAPSWPARPSSFLLRPAEALTPASELPLPAHQRFQRCGPGCCRKHSSANQHAWLR